MPELPCWFLLLLKPNTRILKKIGFSKLNNHWTTILRLKQSYPVNTAAYRGLNFKFAIGTKRVLEIQIVNQ